MFNRIRATTAANAQATQQQAPILTQNVAPMFNSEPAHPLGDANAQSIYDEILSSEYVVSANDLSETLLAFVNAIPKSDAYTSKEVRIHAWGEDLGDRPFDHLLSAGTLPLDALLFVALGADDTKNGIFDVKGPLASDAAEGRANRLGSYRLFTAIIEFFFTRGSLPGMGNVDAPLSKNMTTRTLQGLNITTEGAFSQFVSSASIRKFPRQVFFKMNIRALDQVTATRITLSPAGTKFMRYCDMANTFSKSATGFDAGAKRMREFISKLNHDQLMAFHPDHPNASQKKQKLSQKLCVLMMKSVSLTEQKTILEYIKDKNMASLMKDTSLYKNEGGVLSCPGTVMPDYHDPALTVEWLEAYINASVAMH